MRCLIRQIQLTSRTLLLGIYGGSWKRTKSLRCSFGRKMSIDVETGLLLICCFVHNPAACIIRHLQKKGLKYIQNTGWKQLPSKVEQYLLVLLTVVSTTEKSYSWVCIKLIELNCAALSWNTHLFCSTGRSNFGLWFGWVPVDTY